MRTRRFGCVCGGLLLWLAASSALCAAGDPLAGKTIDKAFIVEGKEYPYKIYLPTGYDGRKKFPVLVALHGLGGDMESFANIGPAISAENYVIITPQAPLGPRNPSESGFSWLQLDTEGKILPSSLELSEKIVLAALDDAINNYNGDGKSVFLTGFSQGGHMTYVIGMRNFARFRALIPCSGGYDYFRDLIGEGIEKAKAVPVLQMVGRLDEDKGEGLYPINLKENKLLREMGYDARLLTYPVGHALCSPQFQDMNDWIQLRLAERRATAEILKDLEKAEGFDRLPLIISLAMNDDEQALGFAEQLIKEGKSNDELCAAATGLILNGNVKADALLGALLENNTDEQVRVTTLHAVGMRGVGEMGGMIRKILDADGPRAVRMEAFLALLKSSDAADADLMAQYMAIKITEVMPEGQAVAVGLKAGDFIVEYDGVKIRTQKELLDAVKAAAHRGGVKMAVERDGGRLEFEVKGGQLGVRISMELRLPE